jgi:hypothetical protein
MSRLVDRTHGRWPWVAVACALPATTVFAANRERLRRNLGWAFWAPLPLYFWHQTEEWVWPGGFLPWFNRTVLESDEDEFPITRRLGFVINAGIGWSLATASGLRGIRSPLLGAVVLGQIVGNAALHVALTIQARRYTPGVATSVVALGPVGVAGLVALARDPRVGTQTATLGAVAGIASGSVMLTTLRRRRQALDGA